MEKTRRHLKDHRSINICLDDSYNEIMQRMFKNMQRHPYNVFEPIPYLLRHISQIRPGTKEVYGILYDLPIHGHLATGLEDEQKRKRI